MQPIRRDFTFDLRRLRVLQALEQRGTVAATAEALHLTPSAVSQQLAGLSRDVGVQLLEKHGRGVRLTGPARVLLTHASVVQEQLELARADLAAWHDGGHRRGAGVRPVDGHLRRGRTGHRRAAEQRPSLDVRVAEDEPPGLFARLDAGDVDIAIAADYRDAPSRHDPRYHRVDLITDIMDVVVPQGHPLANPDGVRLVGLRGRVVGRHRRARTRARRSCSPSAPSPGSARTCGTTAPSGTPSPRWSSAGAGVALIPRLAQPLRQSDLVVCPVIGTTASRLIFAVVRAGAQNDASTAAVLATLQAVAAARPDAA